MILKHFQTFLWLQWRLRVNQLRRGGTLNAVVLAILIALLVMMSIGMFAGSFLIGVFALGDVAPAVVMYVWDGVVLAFLFCWAIGLMSDLQRSESISLQNFMHLPVSLSGVFALNYLSSLLSLTLNLVRAGDGGIEPRAGNFARPGNGSRLTAGRRVLADGAAVTYQFQGWLASLMINKTPAADGHYARDLRHHSHPASAEPDQHLSTVEETGPTDRGRVGILSPTRELARAAGLVAARGDGRCGGELPLDFGGTLGMGLIGAASLGRAYKTTVRIYTGEFTGGSAQPAGNTAERAPANPTPAQPRATNVGATTAFLERSIPGVSEQTAAIALTSFAVR